MLIAAGAAVFDALRHGVIRHPDDVVAQIPVSYTHLDVYKRQVSIADRSVSSVYCFGGVVKRRVPLMPTIQSAFERLSAAS